MVYKGLSLLLYKAFCNIVHHSAFFPQDVAGNLLVTESLSARLAGFVMTHDLSANRLKAQQRLIERLDIIEAGGYEEFWRVLDGNKNTAEL